MRATRTIVATAAIFGAVVLLAAGTGYYAGAQSASSGIGLSGNQTVVDQSEVLSKKNGLAASKAGPRGNATFTCTDTTCRVNVSVDEFRRIEILHVTVYTEDALLREAYLHPGQSTVTYRNVTTNASVTLAIPIEDKFTGQWWRKTYSMSFQSAGGSSPSRFQYNATATYVILNEEYFFGGPPENQTAEVDDAED